MRVEQPDPASAASQNNHPLPVAIVGGGPAGMALALALRIHGADAEIFEARDRAAVRRDPRVLALSDGARQILDWLGVWAGLPATPIETIHISQRGGFGRTLLRASELEARALGWVLPASDLIAALDSAVSAAGIAYRENTKVGAGDTAHFKLTAFAEGAVDPAAGTMRDYGQHAVLCSVSVAAPHQNVAWERFTSEGPVALLPMAGGHYGAICGVASGDAARVLALDDAAYAGYFQHRFGWRAGRVLRAGARSGYPIARRVAERVTAPRCVVMGNAAQTLHPIGAQGFNLGLRDALSLAEVLAGDDPGAPALLSQYAERRREDRERTLAFSDGLARATANPSFPMHVLRSLGLLALGHVPGLADPLVSGAMGFRGRVPALSRGRA